MPLRGRCRHRALGGLWSGEERELGLAPLGRARMPCEPGYRRPGVTAGALPSSQGLRPGCGWRRCFGSPVDMASLWIRGLPNNLCPRCTSQPHPPWGPPVVKGRILSPLLWEPANAARKRLTAGRVSGVSPMAQGAGGIGSPSLQAAGGTQGSRLRTPGRGAAAAGGSRPGGVCGDHVLGAGAGRSEQAFCLFLDAFVSLRPEKDRVQY